MTKEEIKSQMLIALANRPLMFDEILEMFSGESYRQVLKSWGELGEEGKLSRTPQGMYLVKNQ